MVIAQVALYRNSLMTGPWNILVYFPFNVFMVGEVGMKFYSPNLSSCQLVIEILVE